MQVTTVGADPARIDIEVYPGEPVDFTVPVPDSAGVAQDVSLWTVSAQARAARSTAVLHTFTLDPGEDGVTVTVTEDETASWAAWSVPSARWDLWVTPPGGDATPLATGWVRVKATVTH